MIKPGGLPPIVPPKAEAIRYQEEKTSKDKTTHASSTPTDEVTLSGRSLMLSRLYNGVEPGTAVPRSGSDVQYMEEYLTDADRDLLAKMYAYSAENNIDLRHVDALAGDLGAYRAFGHRNAPSQLYDTTGRELTIEFSQENQQAAARISEVASSSELDQGFLSAELTVGGRGANFNFLEKMVKVFSTNPSADTTEKIEDYDPARNKLVSTAADVPTLTMPVEEMTLDSRDGKWRSNGIASSENAKILEHLNEKNYNPDFVKLMLGLAVDNRSSAPAFLEMLRSIESPRV